MLDSRLTGAQRGANQLIAIEINESIFLITHQLLEAASRNHKLRVALTSGSLSHEDGLSSDSK
jgi:hypothetical protein